MKMKRLLKVLIVFTAVAIVAAVLLVRHANRPPQLPDDFTGYAFRDGRLWATLSDGRRRAAALIDTGTSMSVFPKSWPGSAERTGSETVATPFGTEELPAFETGRIALAGRPFESRGALVTDASFPVIGSDFLFESGNVLFSQAGLDFDVDYDADRAVQCAPLVIGFHGNSIHTPVASIFMLLTIDGVEQKVFFDTGIREALQGTALAPAPEPRPRSVPDVSFNSFGQWGYSPFYSRSAAVTLGRDRLPLSYRHYYKDESVPAPFTLGAGILQHYSILVDRQKGRACFFRRLAPLAVSTTSAVQRQAAP